MFLLKFFSSKDKSQANPADQSKGKDIGEGLEKTKESVLKKLSRAVVGKSRVDDSVLDDLEEVLISSDVGVNTTIKIIERIEERVKKDKYLNTSELNNILREEITQLLEENETEAGLDFFKAPLPTTPYVIMVMGVNGVGKTTTIAKLAHSFIQNGKKVYLGAADTFRAAAIEQLELWSNRVGAKMIKRTMNSDPASVAYDTVESAKANNIDVAIIDTAGRLHNKVNLMNELGKIRKVVQKVIPEAPHELLLVLDASTGQNAFEQAKHFTNVSDINTLALTKLDGTAKGGVVIGVSEQFKVPVKYIGTGEGLNDLQIFDRKAFVNSLFQA
jgi:fused signal recognition particle receptor